MRSNPLTVFGAILAAAVLCGPAVLAGSSQQHQQTTASATAGQQSLNQFEYMSRLLHLTPQQKPKVKVLVEEQMKQWQVLGENKTLNGKQKILEMEAINASTEKEIEKLLTPEQKRKLKAFMTAGKTQFHSQAMPKAPPKGK